MSLIGGTARALDELQRHVEHRKAEEQRRRRQQEPAGPYFRNRERNRRNERGRDRNIGGPAKHGNAGTVRPETEAHARPGQREQAQRSEREDESKRTQPNK